MFLELHQIQQLNVPVNGRLYLWSISVVCSSCNLSHQKCGKLRVPFI